MTASFNQAMNSGTITGWTFTLARPENTYVQGAVGYNAGTSVATFTRGHLVRAAQMAEAKELNSTRYLHFRAPTGRIRLCLVGRRTVHDKSRPGGKSNRVGRPDPP